MAGGRNFAEFIEAMIEEFANAITEGLEKDIWLEINDLDWPLFWLPAEDNLVRYCHVEQSKVVVFQIEHQEDSNHPTLKKVKFVNDLAHTDDVKKDLEKLSQKPGPLTVTRHGLGRETTNLLFHLPSCNQIGRGFSPKEGRRYGRLMGIKTKDVMSLIMKEQHLRGRVEEINATGATLGEQTVEEIKDMFLQLLEQLGDVRSVITGFQPGPHGQTDLAQAILTAMEVGQADRQYRLSRKEFILLWIAVAFGSLGALTGLGSLLYTLYNDPRRKETKPEAAPVPED